MILNAEFGIWNSESPLAGAARSAFRLPPSELGSGPRKKGFTLVELLIVISILAILSALLLGVAARAGESGREARTKSMIARLHTLVMEQYGTYKNRRAPLAPEVETAITNYVPQQQRGRARAEARLYALRELMIMEMPDRWSDVLQGPVPDNPSYDNDHRQRPVYLRSESSSVHEGATPLVEAFRRQYYAMVAANIPAETIQNNQAAECLYMIVMFSTADGEARSLFNESSIGDTDGDGAPEFIDGWGNPISFIRWAPGLDSDLQLNANELEDAGATAWQEAATKDHDPLDVFHVDPTAFRLVPFIYSAGSDETYNLFTARNTTVWPNGSNTAFLPNHVKLLIHRKFEAVDDGGSVLATEFIGTGMDESGLNADPAAGADNITNHNITAE